MEVLGCELVDVNNKVTRKIRMENTNWTVLLLMSLHHFLEYLIGPNQ